MRDVVKRFACASRRQLQEAIARGMPDDVRKRIESRRWGQCSCCGTEIAIPESPLLAQGFEPVCETCSGLSMSEIARISRLSRPNDGDEYVGVFLDPLDPNAKA